MPNHVTTVVKASPKVIYAFTTETSDLQRAQHKQDYERTQAGYLKNTGKPWPYPFEELPDRYVDFNCVIPQPDNMETGGCPGGADENYLHENGEVCWYQWNNNNWDTKWNAYDSRIEPISGDLCEVRFDTAWSHPAVVIDALVRKFDDEPVYVQYADEDLGGNLGAYVAWHPKGDASTSSIVLNSPVPSTVLDLLANFPFISIPLCLDIAAPSADYSDEAVNWAHMLKYGIEAEFEEA